VLPWKYTERKGFEIQNMNTKESSNKTRCFSTSVPRHFACKSFPTQLTVLQKVLQQQRKLLSPILFLIGLLYFFYLIIAVPTVLHNSLRFFLIVVFIFYLSLLLLFICGLFLHCC